MTDDERSENGDPNQQPDRKREEVRNRTDEERAMSGDPSGRLGALDDALETQNYPITTDELVDAYGDYEVDIQSGTESLEDVFAQIDNQTYDSADDVRGRILGLIHR